MNPNTRFLWFVAGIGIAMMIGMCSLHQAQADPSRSVFDGVWKITFTDGQGNKTIYDNCRVTDLNDVFVTFTYGGRRKEIKLPVVSGTSTTIMQRER